MKGITSIAVGVVCIASATVAHAKGAQECLDAANKGQDLRDSGKLRLAREEFMTCSAKSCPSQVRADCTDWLMDVQRRTPSIVFRAADPSGQDLTDVKVSMDAVNITEKLDGKPVDVDPGAHLVRFEKSGMKPLEQKVVVVQGEKERVVAVRFESSSGGAIVTTKPAPAPAEGRSVPLGSWIGWGVGAAGLLVFAGFGLKANLDYSHLHSTCGTQCAPSDRDGLKTTMLVADLGLIVGVVSGGIGTVLYLLQPSGSSERVSLDHASR
jgi:hypothetical protein